MSKRSTLAQLDDLLSKMDSSQVTVAFVHFVKVMEKRGFTREMQNVLGNRNAESQVVKHIFTSEIDNAFELIIEGRSKTGNRNLGRKSERIEQIWELFKQANYDRITIDAVKALMPRRKDPPKAASSLISQVNMLWRQKGVNLCIHAETVRAGTNNGPTTVYWVGRPIKPSAK